jgi:hypothetical protein
MRALREAATRGDATGARNAVRASSTRPRRTGRPPGNVPEVPQVLSSRKQILRILWHPSTDHCTPDGDATRAGATACGPPKARGATTASAPDNSTSTADSARGPARASSSTAPGGSAPSSAAACGSTATTCRPARASPSTAPSGSTPTADSAGRPAGCARSTEPP